MPFLFFLFFTFLSEVGFTSQEGVLSNSFFEVSSEGIANSGKVRVTGKRNSHGEFDYIKVEAFGKVIDIDKKLTADIPLGSNGVQISFEAGYRGRSSKRIYLTFLKGFTSEIQQKLVIVVPEKGNARLLSQDIDF